MLSGTVFRPLYVVNFMSLLSYISAFSENFQRKVFLSFPCLIRIVHSEKHYNLIQQLKSNFEVRDRVRVKDRVRVMVRLGLGLGLRLETG